MEIKYTKEQQRFIENCVNRVKKRYPLTTGSGLAGCVDKDTEFLTPSGWKKISSFKPEDLVAEFDEKTNKISFKKPLKYIKKPCSKMFSIRPAQGLDMVLSEEHKILYYTQKQPTKPKTIFMRDMLVEHLNNKKGWGGKIKTTFEHDGPGIDFTEGELRLQVAVMADGRIVKEGANNYTEMRFAKKRKYERLIHLCEKFGLKYDDRGWKPEKKYSSGKEYQVIVWPKTKDKEFHEKYYQCSKEQLEIINDEVKYWDGELNNRLIRYCTTSKKSADFIQFCFASLGKNTSIIVDNRYNNLCYTVNGSYRGGGFRTIHRSKMPKPKIDEVIPSDGFKYCFTTSTGFFVARRNNKIFVTGNSGKTTCLKEIVNQIPNAGVCTFTGKASDVLRRKGIHSKTIHSLIYEWSEKYRRFFLLKKVPYSCFIIDEASMVGKELFTDLQSFGIPILAIGDHGQLEPVSSKELNLVRDSDFKLTEIHRQAKGNPIVELAHLVRSGMSWEGFKKGNCEVTRKRPTVRELLTYDVIGCGFNKTRISINTAVREGKKFPLGKIVPGDKLMCVQNDKDLGAFNGQTFQVLEIKESRAKCQFFNEVREISLTTDHLNRKSRMSWDEVKNHKGKRFVVEFGYACTVHKLQGDQAERVLFMDEQAKDLWCPKRHRYTAITRAEKEFKAII